MNKSRQFHCALALGLAGLAMIVTGCGRAADAPARNDGQLLVAVSILPQRYIVEQVGGDAVHVEVMVGPGESPELYEPSTAQLRALRDTMLYMRIGVPFETTWLPRFASLNPAMRLVDTISDIQRISMHPDHYHETKFILEPSENVLDPHVWLSPALVKLQAETITDALAAARPKREEYFRGRMTDFGQRLDRLHAEIQEILADLPSRHFLVYHPAWAYFARDYRLKMIPIERGGQEPSAPDLVAVIDNVRRYGIRVIFAQPEVSSASARVIAEQIGGRVVEISPLAADWEANLRRVARAIAEAAAG